MVVGSTPSHDAVRYRVISEIGDRFFWGGGELSWDVIQVTQPCIPPGLLNRVPASAGVKARKSPVG